MPIQVAITRRVRLGCEAEFQRALLEFFQASFADGGVWGANLLTPPPGSTSREFGILRTFSIEQERDAFRRHRWQKKGFFPDSRGILNRDKIEFAAMEENAGSIEFEVAESPRRCSQLLDNAVEAF